MKERPINLNKKPNSVQLPVYAQFINKELDMSLKCKQ